MNKEYEVYKTLEDLVVWDARNDAVEDKYQAFIGSDYDQPTEEEWEIFDSMYQEDYAQLVFDREDDEAINNDDLFCEPLLGYFDEVIDQVSRCYPTLRIKIMICWIRCCTRKK